MPVSATGKITVAPEVSARKGRLVPPSAGWPRAMDLGVPAPFAARGAQELPLFGALNRERGAKRPGGGTSGVEGTDRRAAAGCEGRSHFTRYVVAVMKVK